MKSERITVIKVFLVIVGLLLSVRLFSLQVVNGKAYLET